MERILKPKIQRWIKRLTTTLCLIAIAYFISDLLPVDLWYMVSTWLKGSDSSYYFKVVKSDGVSIDWVWLIISSLFLFIYGVLQHLKNKA